jgi:16S rRNA (guanine1207-N2)-methyltransferase
MRAHKSIPFLLATESPDSYRPRIIYRPSPELEWPFSLVVDYDVSRLRRGSNPWVRCAEAADIDEHAASMLMFVSKYDALDQIEYDLGAASRILAPEGELRVVVPRKNGLSRIRALVERGFADVLAAKTADGDLLVARAATPFEAREPASHVAYDDPRSGHRLDFRTRPGMFSPEGIDTGTALLLRHMPDVSGRHVLDVGCGYGAVGLIAAASGAVVTMIDADIRAVKLARANAAANGLTAETVLDDRVRQPRASFDFVLSNPPTHAGSVALHALFEGMTEACRRGAYVLIVVRHQLNYEKWLDRMGHVERLADEAGYKILKIAR